MDKFCQKHLVVYRPEEDLCPACSYEKSMTTPLSPVTPEPMQRCELETMDAFASRVLAAYDALQQKHDAAVADGAAVLREFGALIEFTKKRVPDPEHPVMLHAYEVSAQPHPGTALLAEMERLQKNQHHEHCDTRDTQIPDKPCNCYLFYKDENDALTQENERLKEHIKAMQETQSAEGE